jgi:hypothetical protein
MDPRPKEAAMGLWIAAAVVAAAVAYAWLFHDKGIVMSEEGQILAEGEAILNGRVLYRDIDSFVAPGVWYLAALILGIAGPSLNATRLVMVGLFAATALVVYLLCEHVSSRRIALVAVVLLFVQKALAFPLGAFLFYTEFALFFAMGTVYALMLATERGDRRWALLAGVCLALCGLFKQNIGAVNLLASASYLALFERRRDLIALVLGVPITGGLAVLAAFAAAGALPELFDGLVRTPFTGFASNFSIPYAGALSSTNEFQRVFYYSPALFVEEFVLGDQRNARGLLEPWVHGLAVVLYLVPLLVAVVSLTHVALRRPDGRIRVLLWVGALATFGSAFPRSDFPHVVQGLVGFLPIGLYELGLLSSGRGLRATGYAVVALLVGFAAALVVHMPHQEHFEHPRARLWLSPGTLRTLSGGLDCIEESVPSGDRLAIIPTDAMYYFLAGIEPPLRFTIVLSHNVGSDGGRAAADQIERAEIDWVLFTEIRMPGIAPLEEFAPALSELLRTRFEVARSVGDGRGGPVLLRRRLEPSELDL